MPEYVISEEINSSLPLYTEYNFYFLGHQLSSSSSSILNASTIILGLTYLSICNADEIYPFKEYNKDIEVICYVNMFY